jgi:hypothetical protein
LDGKALLPSIGLNPLTFINWTADSKHLFWLSGEQALFTHTRIRALSWMVHRRQ